MSDQGQKAILLWDGECAFCRKCVEWIEKRDRKKTIQPVPYQEVPSPPMTPQIRRRCRRAILLLQPGLPMLSAGRAALGVLSLLGWEKSAAILSAAPFIFAIEAGYRLIAFSRPFIGRWMIKK